MTANAYRHGRVEALTVQRRMLSALTDADELALPRLRKRLFVTFWLFVAIQMVARFLR